MREERRKYREKEIDKEVDTGEKDARRRRRRDGLFSVEYSYIPSVVSDARRVILISRGADTCGKN